MAVVGGESQYRGVLVLVPLRVLRIELLGSLTIGQLWAVFFLKSCI